MAAATTIGNAVFHSDSDPEDGDFAASEGSRSEEDDGDESDGQDEALNQAERRRRRKQRAAKRKRAAAKGIAEKAVTEAEAAYKELLADEQIIRGRPKKIAARARLSPCKVLSDPLWSMFHRRHEPPKKDCSKKGLLDMLRRYSCGISLATDEESERISQEVAPRTMKSKIRGEVLPAKSGEEGGGELTWSLSKKPEAFKEERISYAGQEHVVLRPASEVLPPGPASKGAKRRSDAASGNQPSQREKNSKATSKSLSDDNSNTTKHISDDNIAGAGNAAVGTTKSSSSNSKDVEALGTEESVQPAQKARKVSTVEKTGLDWLAYKEAHGLHSTDLKKDQSYGGAIERKEFLSRAAHRSKAAHRAEERAYRKAPPASSSGLPR